MKTKLRKSLFFRVMAVFVLAVVLLWALGIFLFEKSRDVMVEQYVDSIQKQVSIYLSDLEEDFQRISRVQEILAADEDLLFLKNKNISNIDFDIVQAINRVIRQLLNAKAGNEYIQEVRVHFLDMGRQLSSGLITYGELDRFRLILEEGSRDGAMRYSDGELYLTTLPYFTASDLNSVSFVVETQLDQKRIVENIRNFNMVDGAVSGIYFDKFDYSLQSGDSFRALYAQTEPGVSTQRLRIQGEPYLAVGYRSEPLHLSYVQFIPERLAFKTINEFRSWYVVFSLLVLLIVIVGTVFSNYEIRKPVDSLVDALHKVEAGDFGVQLDREGRYRNEFAVIFEAFNNMVNRICTLINDVYVQKILIQRAELRQMQAQINPHFLYNSFYILKKRINNGEYEEAKSFTDMLGAYFSFLNKNYRDCTTLSEEVRMAQIYAKIQGIRFRDRIQILFEELPAELEKVTVPQLILQPILENAFKYGLEEIEFDGLLRVSFDSDAEFITVTVEDNAETFSKNDDTLKKLQDFIGQSDQITEVSGLFNIHRRLQLFTGYPGTGLSFSRSGYGGLKVTMRISRVTGNV